MKNHLSLLLPMQTVINYPLSSSVVQMQTVNRRIDYHTLLDCPELTSHKPQSSCEVKRGLVS